jgi:hypothetical protein
MAELTSVIMMLGKEIMMKAILSKQFLFVIKVQTKKIPAKINLYGS